MRKVIAIFLIIAGLVLIARLLYMGSRYNKTTTFSPYTLLNSAWDEYKKNFIDENGRVFDNTQGGITTSEAQSYALLRAVYIDDKPTFDKVWKWTKETLRNKDNLFAWRWGKKGDGSYGVMDNGGANSATDADSDIALALIFASKRWNDDSYLTDAKATLYSIWLFETAEVKGKRYLTAGNWANRPNDLIINPSYFSPFAWRIFAKVDTEHDWKSLVDPSYEVLDISSNSNLDKADTVGLPPNWLAIKKDTGEITATGVDGLNTDYSFDAMRIPFRISLDYIWFHEEKAKNYLTKNFKFLNDEYASKGKLEISYTHDGKATSDMENPAMYATSLGYFVLTDKAKAEKIYQDKIINLYSNDAKVFKSDIPYYEQNWLWFGVSLYNDFLINLSE